MGGSLQLEQFDYSPEFNEETFVQTNNVQDLNTPHLQIDGVPIAILSAAFTMIGLLLIECVKYFFSRKRADYKATSLLQASCADFIHHLETNGTELANLKASLERTIKFGIFFPYHLSFKPITLDRNVLRDLGRLQLLQEGLNLFHLMESAEKTFHGASNAYSNEVLKRADGQPWPIKLVDCPGLKEHVEAFIKQLNRQIKEIERLLREVKNVLIHARALNKAKRFRWIAKFISSDRSYTDQEKELFDIEKQLVEAELGEEGLTIKADEI